MSFRAMQCHAVSCRAMQCHAVSFRAMQCHAMSFRTMQCHAVPCRAMQCHAVSFSAMQCHSVPCSVMRIHAVPRSFKRADSSMQHAPCVNSCYAMLCHIAVPVVPCSTMRLLMLSAMRPPVPCMVSKLNSNAPVQVQQEGTTVHGLHLNLNSTMQVQPCLVRRVLWVQVVSGGLPMEVDVLWLGNVDGHRAPDHGHP